MSYRRRIYFTAEQKNEIWDRWQRGESVSSLGRGFERESSSIYPLLSRAGGIRPPALIKQSQKLPGELCKSLTWDRGKELVDHKRFTMATNIDVYFCDPQSPWQRGTNENTNRLLRQYLARGTDLAVHSQTHLNKIARQLNERPRKTLQFETPADKFKACVAATG